MNSKPKDKGSASGGGNWITAIAAVIVGGAGLAEPVQQLLEKDQFTALEENFDACSGSHMFWFCLAVWRTLWSKKKQMEELEKQVQIHQDYINQDQQVKLVELENLLVERQHMFCSPFKKQNTCQQLEDQIQQWAKALEGPVPDIQTRLQRIFSEDHKCGSTLTYILTRDKTQNGELM
ncbi:hypothetical protein PAMA_001090 [Pampus argenteus]